MCKNEIFIKKSISIHGDRYDYSNINYINNVTKVEIVCKIHGLFQQVPKDHLNNCGCPECGVESMRNKKRNNDWVSDFKKIHGDKYDYSKSFFIEAKSKIEIICRLHGIFKQRPMEHKNGRGCPECGKSKSIPKISENWLEDFKRIHGEEYDYNKVCYKNCKSKVEIICKKHGTFFQTPSSHKSGSGCPKCKISKGEKAILKFLEEKNIKYSLQHSFKGCKSKATLPFDFYLEEMNICIEYDGIQHFECIEHFGGIERFNDQKFKDKIKNDWCSSNNIKLIRISYLDYDKIDDILVSFFQLL